MAEISKQNQSNKTTQDSNDFYDEKNLAMLCHLSSPIGFLFFSDPNFYGIIFPISNFFAPLLIWLIFRNKANSISIHSKKVLNFQITFSIIMIIYQTLFGILYMGSMSYLLVKGQLEELSNLTFEESVDIDSIMRNIDLIMDISPLLLYILGILAIALLGRIFLWPVSFICALIAAMQAKQGKVFNYPLSLEIFK